jgi:methylmalonyl-CoA mutase C-terminal domain/subunit
MEALREHEALDKVVVMGGCIPRHDIPTLKRMGVFEEFPTGSSLENIVDCIEKAAREVTDGQFLSRQ